MRRLARWVGRERPSPAVAVGVGLACAGASTLVRMGLHPLLGPGYPFLTYFVAVIAAAALAGLVGGGAALVSSVLLAWYLYVPPAGSFKLLTSSDLTGVVTFAATGVMSAVLAWALRTALVELTRAEQRQALLIHELNHRVKNTLSTVQSLALQTARSAGSFDGFQQEFAARLTALSGAHDLLTRENWQGAELGALLDEVLRPYGEGQRIRTGGPQVSLSPNAAVTAGLALHELATNAAKYGALARETGRVDVSWGYEGEELAFEWRESGVPDVQPPTRQGFGARLLTAAARELNAEVASEMAADGLAYRWRIPLSRQVRRAPA
ncbi:MAG TPA: HWE histidine kinase domain-containing protein [Caulobacteraceae bacterium]